MPADPAARLQVIQRKMGLANDLRLIYSERLGELQGMTFSEQEEVVSGKYVLKLLKESFPLKGSQQNWDEVLSAYINICPDPPDDLKNILDLIWQDSQSP